MALLCLRAHRPGSRGHCAGQEGDDSGAVCAPRLHAKLHPPPGAPRLHSVCTHCEMSQLCTSISLPAATLQHVGSASLPAVCGHVNFTKKGLQCPALISVVPLMQGPVILEANLPRKEVCNFSSYVCLTSASSPPLLELAYVPAETLPEKFHGAALPGFSTCMQSLGLQPHDVKPVSCGSAGAHAASAADAAAGEAVQDVPEGARHLIMLLLLCTWSCDFPLQLLANVMAIRLLSAVADRARTATCT